MPEALLRISDGETTINLLDTVNGYLLMTWNPGLIEPKNGGIWADSAFSDGRQRVAHFNTNAVESFTLTLKAPDTDTLYDHLQQLRALLSKAIQYWEGSHDSTPVWLEARGPNETNSRFAIIKDWRVVGEVNPFANPFLQMDGTTEMPGIQIALERGDWLELAPGTTHQIPSLQNYNWTPSGAAWTVAKSGLAGRIQSLLYITTDILIAGGDSAIYRSTDGGTTWALVASPTGTVWCFLKAANGYLYAGCGYTIYRSTDDGANWSLNYTLATHTTTWDNIFCIIQLDNGTLVGSGGFQKYIYSTSNGVSWSSIGGFNYNSISLLARPGGGWYSEGQPGVVVYHSAPGSTPVPISNFAHGTVMADYMFMDSRGEIFIARSYDGKMYKSPRIPYVPGQYFTWGECLSFSNAVTDRLPKMIEVSERLYFACANDGSDGVVKYSDDWGVTWINDYVFTGNTPILSLAQKLNGDMDIFAGGNTTIERRNTVTGAGVVCGSITSRITDVFLTNHEKITNLSHIFYDNAGFSANLYPMGAGLAAGVNFLPVALNNAVYFGIESTITNYAPFHSLIFNLKSALVPLPGNTVAVTWEYWDAGTSAWVDLADDGSVLDETNSFQTPGINAVYFSKITEATVNGVFGYWVRARISVCTGGSNTPPYQGTDEIYTASKNFIEIEDDLIAGDLPALGRLLLRACVSTSANNDFNRVIMGTRSTIRGERFSAFINLSDTQKPNGVLLTLAASCAYGAAAAPTGRGVLWDGSDTAWANLVTIAMDEALSPQYAGTYHAFLRVIVAATPTNYYFRIKTDAGGISYGNPVQPVLTSGSLQLLSLGKITIPASGIQESFGNVQLIIQGKTTVDSATIPLVDLILIPADEWIGDFQGDTNYGASPVVSVIPRYIDIDSVIGFRMGIRGLLRQRDSEDSAIYVYKPVSSGPCVLQTNRQKIWTLLATISGAGFISNYNLLAALQIQANQRYFTGRGNA